MGVGDQVSFYNNWFHDTSGRSPDIGGTATWHFFNNLFTNVAGAFPTWPEPSIEVERNYFEMTENIGAGDNGSLTYYVTADTSAECEQAIGRPCVDQFLAPAVLPSGVLAAFAGQTDINVMPAADVKDHVIANAGTGKIEGARYKCRI